MSKIAGELNAEMMGTINSSTYQAWLNNPLTKALKKSFEQSITDPENQPSQYGTVTLDMYERLEEQLAAFIEKLEALPNWYDNGGNLVVDANELLKIIEQAKEEQAETVAFAAYDLDDASNKCAFLADDPDLELAKTKFNTKIVPLYTASHPTPQDVIDAEKYRWLKSLICNGMSGIAVTYFAGTDFHTVQDAEMLDSVIDQAMKGE